MSAFDGSIFFGFALTLAAYQVGVWVKARTGSSLANPLAIAIALTIVLLVVTGIDYEHYASGARYLTYFLTPITVCMAIPLYEQLSVLKRNWRAILAGIAAGVAANCAAVLLLAIVLGLDRAEYISLLPRTVTTPIGIGLSAEFGGYPPISAAAITFAGVFGNALADKICAVARITDPAAVGLAIGTSAHGLGTARALEIGDVEGAISSLSVVVAGLMTAAVMPLFVPLY